MTRGMRWLIGGVLALVLLVMAVFIGLFGGVWALTGQVGEIATSGLPHGEVTSVDETTRTVTVRFTAPDGVERTGSAVWSGSTTTLPDPGDDVLYSTSPSDPTVVTDVQEDPAATTGFFRDAGVALLVFGAVLVLLVIATLVATAVWAGRAPRAGTPGTELVAPPGPAPTR